MHLYVSLSLSLSLSSHCRILCDLPSSILAEPVSGRSHHCAKAPGLAGIPKREMHAKQRLLQPGRVKAAVEASFAKPVKSAKTRVHLVEQQGLILQEKLLRVKGFLASLTQ